MDYAPNVYSADPAFPVLADSLLQQAESRTEASAPLSYDTTHNSDWSLHEDWKKGIQSTREVIFRCGVVLGFSRLRMRSRESNEYIGQVRITPRN